MSNFAIWASFLDISQSKTPFMTRYLAPLFFYLILSVTPATHAQINQNDVDEFARNYAYQNKRPLAEIETILNQATFQPSIIEKMERPAEKTMTWTRYRNIFMKEERIQAGADFWIENEAVLQSVSTQSGIPEEIILGIIGVETFFGQRKGTYSVLDALYTLAFGYPKRSSFFKSELGKFLELCHQENLDPTQIKGSYAGAMGYCQFMPSSYLAYAKNFDGEGGTDLVNNVDDAIASVANYLEVHRWKTGERIAVQAAPTDDA
jgi:membrane-bound lytic murein transglycosylase B